MALIENTDISAEQITREGLEALNPKYQKSIGFFAWDFFAAIGKILYSLWQKVIYTASCLIDLSNMEFSDLENFVFQTRGITAKKAVCSSGYLTLTNGQGTILSGTLFETQDKTRFISTETVNLLQGDKFKVECELAGIVGNVPANSITKIPTTIQGIVSVTNEEAFSNGYEQESKEDLLTRYYEDIQTPVTSGNAAHYRKWAKEVTHAGT